MAKLADKIGLLGCGNMGRAILKGIIGSGKWSPENIGVYDTNPDALKGLNTEEFSLYKDFKSFMNSMNWVVLGIKPQMFSNVAKQLCEFSNKTFISIMAGIQTEVLQAGLGETNQVIRVMPNLPLSVQSGAIGIEMDGVEEKTLLGVEEIFKGSGECVRVQASQMDAVTGFSGSGPMYVLEFLEGFIEAGVKSGLARPIAEKLAAQNIRGAIDIWEKTGTYPGEIVSQICSAGGTTIYGLHELQKNNFKGSIISAVEAAAKRSKDLS